MIIFRDFEKVKINIIKPNFWYQPSIFTASRRKYAARPYKSFNKLLKLENLIDRDFMFTFNGDENFEMFRRAQTLKSINFFLNYSQIESIETNGFIDYLIPKSRITIRYTKKSLIALKRGYVPYFSIKYLNNYFKTRQKITITWTKRGYIKVN